MQTMKQQLEALDIKNRRTSCLTSSVEGLASEKLIDRLFLRMTTKYMAKWTSIFTSEEITIAVRREWQIALAGIDAKVISKALDMVSKAFAEWPPTSMQFASACRSIERDQRMKHYEAKQIGNHNPDFAKQQLHKIMRKLRPAGINAWQRVHGMRHFV